MGGHTKSTGSNKSEFRKESTKKFKKEKAADKKLNYKIDKFGYKVKKNIVEQYTDKNLVGNVLGPIKDSHNLFRRSRFADQNNIDISKMSTKEIMSKSFKAKLMSKGYLDPKAGGDLGQGGQAGEKGQVKLATAKSTEQPKVASQMDNSEVKSDLITADKTAPTTVEMANAELTDDERMLKVKRGKKTKTVLTDLTGLKNKPTLSQKALLG